MALSHKQIGEAVGVTSVRAYGAKGYGGADDTAAFSAASAAAGKGGQILVPDGEYQLTSTVSLLAGQTIVGAGTNPNGTLIIANGVTGPLFKLDPNAAGEYFNGNGFKQLRIETAGGAGLTRIISTIPDSTNYIQEFIMRDVVIDTTSRACSDSAVVLENVIGGVLDAVSFRGNCGTAHIALTSASVTHSVGNNAITLSNIYSSSNTSTPYGIYAVGTSAAKHQVLLIQKPVLHTHTVAGIYLEHASVVDIHTPYLEQNARALIAGSVSNSADVKKINIIGGYLYSGSGKYGFLLDFVEGCTITNVDFQGLNESRWIEIGRVGGMAVTGHVRDATTDTIHAHIFRNANMHDQCGIFVFDSGHQDGFGKLDVGPSITMLDDDTGTVVGRRHWIMRVDGTGAWTATSWIPTSV